jgi:hypothetical protein
MLYSKRKTQKNNSTTKPKIQKVPNNTSGMSLAERRKRQRTIEENKKAMRQR